MRKLFLTFFYTGLLPKAPGTWGTIAGAAAALPILYYFQPTTLFLATALLSLVAINEINKEEARSRNIFVAGWRPFVGWTCGMALAYTYVIQPILIFGLAHFGYWVDLPPLDMSTMMPVLLGMLGLGGLRSFEKYKGVSK